MAKQMAVVTGTFLAGNWVLEQEMKDKGLERQEYDSANLYMHQVAAMYIHTLPQQHRDRLQAVHVTLLDNEIKFGDLDRIVEKVGAGKSWWWYKGSLVQADPLEATPQSSEFINMAAKMMAAMQMHEETYNPETQGYDKQISDCLAALCGNNRLEYDLLDMLCFGGFNDVYDWSVNVLYNRQLPDFLYEDEEVSKVEIAPVDDFKALLDDALVDEQSPASIATEQDYGIGPR